MCHDWFRPSSGNYCWMYLVSIARIMLRFSFDCLWSDLGRTNRMKWEFPALRWRLTHDHTQISTCAAAVHAYAVPVLSCVTTENEETGRRLCCYGDRWRGTSPYADPVTSSPSMIKRKLLLKIEGKEQTSTFWYILSVRKCIKHSKYRKWMAIEGFYRFVTVCTACAQVVHV